MTTSTGMSTDWDNTCTFGLPEVFACEVCGTVFPQKWRLEVHQLSVAGSRYCRVRD